MKNNPLVSVVISIYKESVFFVSQAIESIRNQTYTNLEIIVLLDYPENVEVKSYLNKLRTKEPRLICLFNETNLGLVSSLNRGIIQSQGEYICRMDADDISELDRIEKQLNFLRTYNLDIVGSYISLIDMDGNPIGRSRVYPTTNKYIYEYMRYASPIPHPTWFVKKDVYVHLKNYRNIRCAEDYDFLIRAYLHSYKMGVVPQDLLKYRVNQGGITQQNIASQKIVSQYIMKQIKNNCIFTEEEISDYRKKNKKKELKLQEYYSCGKALKKRKKVKFIKKVLWLFNCYNFTEVKQRMMCKLIIYKDGKNDNN